MKLLVLTPEKEVFNGNVTAVKVPGSLGEFVILENHAPIVSSLEKGMVTITTENNEEIIFSINNGFIEVDENVISLLVQGYSA